MDKFLFDNKTENQISTREKCPQRSNKKPVSHANLSRQRMTDSRKAVYINFESASQAGQGKLIPARVNSIGNRWQIEIPVPNQEPTERDQDQLTEHIAPKQH